MIFNQILINLLWKKIYGFQHPPIPKCPYYNSYECTSSKFKWIENHILAYYLIVSLPSKFKIYIFIDITKNGIIVCVRAKDIKFSVKITCNMLTSTETSAIQVNGRNIQSKVWKSLWKINGVQCITLFV